MKLYGIKIIAFWFIFAHSQCHWKMDISSFVSFTLYWSLLPSYSWYREVNAPRDKSFKNIENWITTNSFYFSFGFFCMNFKWMDHKCCIIGNNISNRHLNWIFPAPNECDLIWPPTYPFESISVQSFICSASECLKRHYKLSYLFNKELFEWGIMHDCLFLGSYHLTFRLFNSMSTGRQNQAQHDASRISKRKYRRKKLKHAKNITS